MRSEFDLHLRMKPLLRPRQALLWATAAALLFCTARGQDDSWSLRAVRHANETSGRTNAIFAAGVAALFSSFISDAGNSTKFRNATSGGIYAVFTCAPNATAGDCQSCLRAAASTIAPSCPDPGNGTTTCFSSGYAWANAWANGCFLRYSSADSGETGPATSCWNATGRKELSPGGSLFGTTPFELISALAARAAAGRPPSWYADGRSDGNLTSGLAQCAGDLSSSDCLNCLGKGVTELQDFCGVRMNSTAGNYISGGCRVAYSSVTSATPWSHAASNSAAMLDRVTTIALLMVPVILMLG